MLAAILTASCGDDTEQEPCAPMPDLYIDVIPAARPYQLRGDGDCATRRCIDEGWRGGEEPCTSWVSPRVSGFCGLAIDDQELSLETTVADPGWEKGRKCYLATYRRITLRRNPSP